MEKFLNVLRGIKHKMVDHYDRNRPSPTKTKFFVTGYWGPGMRMMLKNIRHREDVSCIDKDVNVKYLKKFFESCCKRKDKVTGNLHWEKFWYSRYTLSKIKYKRNDNNYIILFNSALTKYYSPAYFRWLKRKNPNIKLILYIVDQIDRCPRIPSFFSEFDVIYTIIDRDAKEYNLNYYPLLYSKLPFSEDKTQYDIYFCGTAVRRAEKLNSLHKKFKEQDINDMFYVAGASKVEACCEGIEYNKALTYEENVAMVMKSNCLLEVMHTGVNAPTQRYLEALCYNKKLLTNNQYVCQYPYYNPEYIQVFSSIDDIDFAWISQKADVDYHYQGDYEPNIFLEDIRNRLKK